MSNSIIIGIAEYKTSSSPNKLVTLGLGSCIAVCIYDSQKKIGGLSHIMLPFMPNDSKYSTSLGKYADTAIPLMVEELIDKGACRKNLVSKIVGGANMFSNLSNDKQSVGERNQIAVKEILKSLNIPIISEELGGNIGRSITLDLETLKLTIRARGNSFEI